MAAAKEPGGGGKVVLWGSLLAAAGLVALIVVFDRGADEARGELELAKENYKRMVAMKRQLEEYKKKNPGRSPSDRGLEDLLQFFSAKARQAGIPQGLFNVTPNPVVTYTGWKETAYTINLRAPSKENSVSRASIVDFLKLVEDERPSVRSKNLALQFAGQDFQSAVVTFSYFLRTN
jgi:hypothetical protein